MKKSNYDLVLEVIENFEDLFVLEEFKNEFKEGENISEKEFVMFCKRYMDDMSELYYINLNWKYIESGGDDSVFDESDDEEE